MDETQELEERFAQLREDLKGNYLQDFRENFLEMHIYEQSQFYQTLEKKQRQLVYAYLSPKELADMFDALEEDNENIKDYLGEMRAN